jgi:hypothetical protein
MLAAGLDQSIRDLDLSRRFLLTGDDVLMPAGLAERPC